jgi:hypothetical protein
MIEFKVRKILVVLSSMAVLGAASLECAYARDGGFPYERTGDTDSVNGPSSNQMTPIETAGGGGGAGGGSGGVARGATRGSGSGSGSGAGAGTGMGTGAGTSSGESGSSGTSGSSSGQ